MTTGRRHRSLVVERLGVLAAFARRISGCAVPAEEAPAGEETRKVHVLEVLTGQTRALVEVGVANFLPTWSPDSR